MTFDEFLNDLNKFAGEALSEINEKSARSFSIVKFLEDNLGRYVDAQYENLYSAYQQMENNEKENRTLESRKKFLELIVTLAMKHPLFKIH